MSFLDGIWHPKLICEECGKTVVLADAERGGTSVFNIRKFVPWARVDLSALSEDMKLTDFDRAVVEEQPGHGNKVYHVIRLP